MSMRIAEVAPPWLAVPPLGYGGIELVVALLADGLVEHGHDVTLFASGDSRTKAHLRSSFPRAPGPKYIQSMWHDTVHALDAFRDPSRYDVFHVHAPFASLASGVVSGGPVVHTVHGPFTEDMVRLYEACGDRVLFVAISEAQRSKAPHLPFGGVVYNGVDVGSYPFRAVKDDFLLFLGRSAPEKGALRAALAARRAGVPLVLAVKVAEPSEERYWRDEVEPQLPSDATVLREISFDHKVDLLSRARAVLFPIDWDEPFGLVMTEAMACGTPVVATPRGSVPEVVADGLTGYVVPVEDYPDRAAEAVSRLGEIDPAACRRWVEQRFSKEAMVRGYERVFDVAVSSSAWSERRAAAGSGSSSR